MTPRSLTSQMAHRMGRSMPSGILARFGFGAFAASVVADELASADGYRALLARGGGKFTDSLERDAALRLRGNSGGF